MARRKTTFKLDILVLEQDIALAQVVGDNEQETLIRDFCYVYAIPLSEEHIMERSLMLGVMKDALDQEQKKQKNKK